MGSCWACGQERKFFWQVARCERDKAWSDAFTFDCVRSVYLWFASEPFSARNWTFSHFISRPSPALAVGWSCACAVLFLRAKPRFREEADSTPSHSTQFKADLGKQLTNRKMLLTRKSLTFWAIDFAVCGRLIRANRFASSLLAISPASLSGRSLAGDRSAIDFPPSTLNLNRLHVLLIRIEPQIEARQFWRLSSPNRCCEEGAT